MKLNLLLSFFFLSTLGFAQTEPLNKSLKELDFAELIIFNGNIYSYPEQLTLIVDRLEGDTIRSSCWDTCLAFEKLVNQDYSILSLNNKPWFDASVMEYSTFETKGLIDPTIYVDYRVKIKQNRKRRKQIVTLVFSKPLIIGKRGFTGLLGYNISPLTLFHFRTRRYDYQVVKIEKSCLVLKLIKRK